MFFPTAYMVILFYKPDHRGETFGLYFKEKSCGYIPASMLSEEIKTRNEAQLEAVKKAFECLESVVK